MFTLTLKNSLLGVGYDFYFLRNEPRIIISRSKKNLLKKMIYIRNQLYSLVFIAFILSFNYFWLNVTQRYYRNCSKIRIHECCYSLECSLKDILFTAAAMYSYLRSFQITCLTSYKPFSFLTFSHFSSFTESTLCQIQANY